jgi:hypothetical protein
MAKAGQTWIVGDDKSDLVVHITGPDLKVDEDIICARLGWT